MRLRVTFAKREPISYASHLDLMRAWERALRRARVPLRYSKGFNPHARLQLAAALPLGHTGENELLDLWLERVVPPLGLESEVQRVLPEGLTVKSVEEVSEKAAALPREVESATYSVRVEMSPAREEMEERIAAMMSKPKMVLHRRGKPYDLRPLVERLWLESILGSETHLGMQLAAREGNTGRPEAVVEALGMGGALTHYCRIQLILGSG